MKVPVVLPSTQVSVLPEAGRTALALHIAGYVQGVGFRPYVARLARSLGLCGWVRNQRGGVLVHAEGCHEHLVQFVQELPAQLPMHARIERICEAYATPELHPGFTIEESVLDDPQADLCLPLEASLCDACREELRDHASRRYRYPFTCCAQCGPRYTMIRAMPYDRLRSSMADFSMCPACQAEYQDEGDRRFHAQGLCCPVCGPELSFQSVRGEVIIGNERALAEGIRLLREGGILAVKGIGGYHLMCDAFSASAVSLMRTRKRRPDKPMAVMVPEADPAELLDMLGSIFEIGPADLERLMSPQRPLMMFPLRPGQSFGFQLAPGLSRIAIMLPYSPLHELLSADFARPIVVTSANVSGQPMVIENMEAGTRLSGVADGFLHHNRSILRPAEDSVFQQSEGRWRPVRMGRSVAPVIFTLPFRLDEPVLALGADLKNTLALAYDDQIILSGHHGDLGSLQSEENFGVRVADFCRMHGLHPSRLLCDAHPSYLSRHWAISSGLPFHSVYHHHAHASAVYAEFGCESPLLVLTWDGTGYGEGHELWGGEALLGQPGAWQRFARLRPMRLIGGEKAVRESWRCGLSLCLEANQSMPMTFDSMDMAIWAWEHAINSPLTSSVGRLFDGAAALLGLCNDQSYEGQAAMQLEAAIRGAPCQEELNPLPLLWQEPLWELDWRGLVPMLLDKKRSVSAKALNFHVLLAMAVETMAVKARAHHGIDTVGFAGGVFQNRCLVEMAARRLRLQGFQVLIPEKLPVNDASISFGQLIESFSASRDSYS